MLESTAVHFPNFARLASRFEPEHVLPPATENEIQAEEASLGLVLPASYKNLLRCTRGFWLMGGAVKFGLQHLFVHEFEPFEALSVAQQAVVRRKAGLWPPPSQGMLCFAEFFMEADGDQVLFDVGGGLKDGEYPVVYYAHEARPPGVRRLAPGFTRFMEEFLEYEAFNDAA